MGDPARREATYDDVRAAPEHLVAELIDGALHLHPRLAKPHANAATVLSPSTERLDRREKLAIYRREGVAHVWLVNPLARTLEVLALGETHYAVLDVFADHERVRGAPFDAVELELGLLWEDVVLG